MAVETNKGGDATISPAQTLTGVAPNGQQARRRKRPSSLLAVATSLPSVESSLDEFIARANQTMADPAEWGNVERAAKEEDESRREADSLRWKAAEQQMREGEAREQSLRRQLDGLQGRLAEAEARAAVATNGGTQDGVIADLKVRLARGDEQLRGVQAQANHLAQELVAAKAAAAEVTAQVPTHDLHPAYDGDAQAEERVRIAEATAVKAIAAAKAAAAGLRISAADIAALESGLVVPLETPRGTNWLAVTGALIGGMAIMFAVSKLSMSSSDKAPAAVPAAQVAPAAPVQAKPIVTPIEEPAPAPQAVAPAPTPTAPAPAAVEEPTIDPTPAKNAAPPAPHHAAVAPAPVPAKHVPPAKQPAKANSGIADPFGDSPAPKKNAKPAAKTEKKPGGIVDPF